jgi:hypothetical protein
MTKHNHTQFDQLHPTNNAARFIRNYVDTETALAMNTPAICWVNISRRTAREAREGRERKQREERRRARRVRAKQEAAVVTDAELIAAAKQVWTAICYDCLRSAGQTEADADDVRDAVATYFTSHSDHHLCLAWDGSSIDRHETILEAAFPDGNTYCF